LLFWLCLFYIGWSLITVPYGAWGAELSSDYDERSRIAAARETWSVLGMLAAVIAPVLVQAPAQGGSVADREIAEIAASVSVQGWLTIGALPILGLIMLRWVPQGDIPIVADRSSIPAGVLLGNRPFLLLITVTMVSAFATGINQTSVVHYYRYVAQLPESSDWMILIYFVAAVIGAPFWGWLAKRFEKHHVLALGLAVNAICQIVMLWMRPGHVLAFSLLQAGSGFAYTGPLILGASMAADVIDLDWLRSGVQRAGFVLAIMTVVQKAFEAIGIGASLPMLEWMGFTVATGYSPQSQFALVTVNVVLPSVLLTLAILPTMLFPLSRRRQRALERALRKYRIVLSGT
jgi:Na+/melibiose symporter-like transporter